MSTGNLDRLLVKIETSLEAAKSAQRRLADQYELGGDRVEGSPEDELAAALRSTRVLMDLALSHASMWSAANTLATAWPEYESKGLGKGEYIREHFHFESRPLSHLSDLAEGLRALVGGSSFEEYELASLERVLRSTAVLVQRRGEVPTKENDVQKVMHDYLGALFDDYKHPVHIDACSTQGFEPDGGVFHLHAAIEFKYANDKQKVKSAIGGVFQDIGGYAGSRDWTRFYSVIYQSEAFFPEGPVTSSIARVGGSSWTPILVTGRGA